MKYLLQLNKLWTVYHFMSIQTIDVACIRRCLLQFFILLCCLCGYHYGLFLLSTCFHIVIIIPQFVQYLSIFLVSFCVFGGIACFVFCTKSALLASVVVIPSSHNITTSLCCCSVDRFILVVATLRYECKLAINTIVKKLFVVDICKP